MKLRTAILAALAPVALLAGCGPDVLGSAATSAASAAASAKQAQQEKAAADQKIQAMKDALQQHDRNLSEQVDSKDPKDKGSE